MTEQTRYPVLQIPVDELNDWYDLGWSYVEAAEVPGFVIIKWESDRPVVAPFRGEASLEGRAA